jgi:ATP-dependent Zn protease
MIPHNIMHTKDTYCKEVQVLLAGKVAEEIFFGDKNISSGASSDLKRASEIICTMVRNLNMDGNVGVISQTNHEKHYLTNISDTNSPIEQILLDQKTIAHDLLQKNMDLFKILIKNLLTKRELTTEHLFELSKNYIPELKTSSLEDTIEFNYYDALKEMVKL